MHDSKSVETSSRVKSKSSADKKYLLATAGESAHSNREQHSVDTNIIKEELDEQIQGS